MFQEHIFIIWIDGLSFEQALVLKRPLSRHLFEYGHLKRDWALNQGFMVCLGKWYKLFTTIIIFKHTYSFLLGQV